MKNSLKNIACVVVLWRVVLFIVGYLGERLISFAPTYPHYEGMLEKLGPFWLVRWGGFDGIHYITIAQRGYFGIGLIQAFFPVYPYFLRCVDFFVHNVVISGILISTMSLILALVVGIKLFMLDDKNISMPATLCSFLLFPVSFFFGAIYTESLFLLLALCTMYFARSQKWKLAILFTGVATATRIIGIFLVPALMIEAYMQLRSRNRKIMNWKSAMFVAMPLLGLAGLFSYMFYLGRTYGDSLYFLHVQAQFGGGRQENLVLFPQVMYRYVKIFLSLKTWSWSYYAYLQEFVLTMIVGVLLTYATLKKGVLRASYLVYAWGTYLLPPLTGTFQSMPRYTLVIFPIFFLITKLKTSHPWWYITIHALGTLLLILNTILFLQGRWVA